MNSKPLSTLLAAAALAFAGSALAQNTMSVSSNGTVVSSPSVHNAPAAQASTTTAADVQANNPVAAVTAPVGTVQVQTAADAQAANPVAEKTVDVNAKVVTTQTAAQSAAKPEVQAQPKKHKRHKVKRKPYMPHTTARAQAQNPVAKKTLRARVDVDTTKTAAEVAADGPSKP